MKFELTLNADYIYEALKQAEAEGVNALSLIVSGKIDKDEKTKVNKIYLHGQCKTDYTYYIRK